MLVSIRKEGVALIRAGISGNRALIMAGALRGQTSPVYSLGEAVKEFTRLVLEGIIRNGRLPDGRSISRNLSGKTDECKKYVISAVAFSCEAN